MLDDVNHFWTIYSGSIVGAAYKLLLSVAIAFACKVVATWVSRVVKTANERFHRLDATLVPILATTARYVVYIIAGMFILDIFGVNTASIITLLGAAGLAVGFALKDTLSNIASGIMLLFLRPINAGEYIEAGSIAGTMQEINLFTSILTTGDGIFVSVPNSAIWGSTIVNYTRNGRRRLNIVVGIDYGDSIDAGLEVLRNIAAAESRFLREPAPDVMVVSMADSAVNLQLRGWTANADFWQTQWDLNKRIKEEIEKAGLSIPFPQCSVHVVQNAGA